MAASGNVGRRRLMMSFAMPRIERDPRPLVADRFIAESIARSCDDLVALLVLVRKAVRRIVTGRRPGASGGRPKVSGPPDV